MAHSLPSEMSPVWSWTIQASGYQSGCHTPSEAKSAHRPLVCNCYCCQWFSQEKAKLRLGKEECPKEQLSTREEDSIQVDVEGKGPEKKGVNLERQKRNSASGN